MPNTLRVLLCLESKNRVERSDIEIRFTWSNIIRAEREKRKTKNDDRQGMKTLCQQIPSAKNLSDLRYDKGQLAVF